MYEMVLEDALELLTEGYVDAAEVGAVDVAGEPCDPQDERACMWSVAGAITAAAGHRGARDGAMWFVEQANGIPCLWHAEPFDRPAEVIFKTLDAIAAARVATGPIEDAATELEFIVRVGQAAPLREAQSRATPPMTSIDRRPEESPVAFAARLTGTSGYGSGDQSGGSL